MSGTAVMDPWVQQAQVLVEQKRRELLRTYPEGVAKAALSRAWAAARWKAQPIRQAVQGQAFYDLLVAELTGTEEWCQGFSRGMQT